MGKAFTTAVRWLAPLGAILAPRRTHTAALSDTKRVAQASNPTPPAREAAACPHQRPQDLIGIAIEQASATPHPDAGPDRTDRGPAAAVPHAHPGSSPPSLRPLRVLRIRESGPHPRQAGRLVISGRMADVCAELERLAAAHPGLVH
ncbi:MAG: hypothetical protein JZU58_10060 [Curvibacter lanceolatus]|jgi:hypothetical protein|uniref:hypothetical protein n=1 Tax=Curvibacter lanceolatus TaxID=86182 RepID=UPI002355704E|nr:hypothetical protein [Curvibacter lanceolatus]MBV5292683.1 hypothetical protein [Curvibacter lanceolatus]